MPEPTITIEPSAESEPLEGEAAHAMFTRMVQLFGSLRAWAYGHWIRSVIIAVVILSLIAVTMAGWAYLASMALRAGEQTIEPALAALDDDQIEQARSLVTKMLQSGLLTPSKYGGPLYVLGAIKMHDAEDQTSRSRRRTEYLVASRYLQEARAYGIPQEREPDGIYRLGKSLIESGQLDEGLRVLDDFLTENSTAEAQRIGDTHQLLAETYLSLPQPNVENALQHNSALLARADMSRKQRATALLRQAESLSRLNRFEDALDSLASISTAELPQATIDTARAKLMLDEIEAKLKESSTANRAGDTGDSSAELRKIIRLLQDAGKQDSQTASIIRQSNYLLGRAFELSGDRGLALNQHARTRQLYGENIEGIASMLAEADLLRQTGDVEAAVLGYRRVLESVDSIAEWQSYILPLPLLRDRIVAALKDLVSQRRYADALILIDHFPPVFTAAEQLVLRGSTLEQWGETLLNESSGEGGQHDPQRTAGLQKLRAAGVAFEQLAELRLASRFYTADLWHSAESYFAGHSFTSAIRILNEYLKSEPELRNAEALLRLGQAYMAIGKLPQCIAALEECIEFHPLDGSTFQARIDCARAYWTQGEMTKAEQLLRDNIAGSSLKPSSREWKDSLFQLGMLLNETDMHEQAIITLEEAIERYPNDPQRLAAQYALGESYRRWGHDMLTQAEAARTTSEREKTVQAANERLRAALQHFEKVQVSITLKSHDFQGDPLLSAMLRNCYMLEGTVLFDLGQYKEAIEAYSNVASLYPDNPFVLETFVQIANCWRRLGQDGKARGAISQARIVLDGLPPNADFDGATALNREEWGMLLAGMSNW